MLSLLILEEIRDREPSILEAAGSRDTCAESIGRPWKQDSHAKIVVTLRGGLFEIVRGRILHADVSSESTSEWRIA